MEKQLAIILGEEGGFPVSNLAPLRMMASLDVIYRSALAGLAGVQLDMLQAILTKWSMTPAYERADSYQLVFSLSWLYACVCVDEDEGEEAFSELSSLLRIEHLLDDMVVGSVEHWISRYADALYKKIDLFWRADHVSLRMDHAEEIVGSLDEQDRPTDDRLAIASNRWNEVLERRFFTLPENFHAAVQSPFDLEAEISELSRAYDDMQILSGRSESSLVQDFVRLDSAMVLRAHRAPTLADVT